jgi:hypothetical protein
MVQAIPPSLALSCLVRRSAPWKAAAMFLLLLFAFPALSLAVRVRPINLEEMTRRADRIFSGRVAGVRIARDPDLDQQVTYVTLVPHRVEKGDVRGSLLIKILGEQDADAPRGRATEGIPVFRKGEELILFLYGDSPHGLTSPVGLGQGKFSVLRDKEGNPLAFNQFANEHLFRGLSSDALRRLGKGGLPERKGIPPEALLDLVHSLQP